jgi:hypothetical protein
MGVGSGTHCRPHGLEFPRVPAIPTTQLITDLVALVVAFGGGAGLVALLTVRERRQQMRAAADHTEAQAARATAEGVAAIVSAAGKGMAAQYELVPQLMERITKLEGLDEVRDRDVAALKEHYEQAREDAAALAAELAIVHRFMDEISLWAQAAFEQNQALGGSISPPPAPPSRRASDAARRLDMYRTGAAVTPPSGLSPAPPAPPPTITL